MGLGNKHRCLSGTSALVSGMSRTTPTLVLVGASKQLLSLFP
jgi:hypothetical protein